MTPTRLPVYLLLCATVLLSACGGGSDVSLTAIPATPAVPAAICGRVPETSTARPASWTDATHAKSGTPNYGLVFATDSVLRLDISVSPCEWQAMFDDLATLLRRDFPNRRSSIGAVSPVGCNATTGTPNGEFLSGTPMWAPATVRFNGQTWNHVGLRFKGSSSLQRSWDAGLFKLPFRLDFDKFDGDHPSISGQRFHGFQKLSFSNQSVDPSFMREKVASDLFREFGVPAGRTGWVRVFLDYGQGPQYLGVYTMTEVPAKPLLAAQFGDSAGNLYKPQGDGANWGRRTAVPQETFRLTFEKETNKGAKDWSDVEAAVDALQAANRTSNPAAWRTALEQRFNVDGFLRWMAANAVLGNGDAYGFIAHNYYLYASSNDSGRLNWITWDHDRALSCPGLDIGFPASGYSATRWPLYRFLLDDSTYRARYLQYAAEFLVSPPFGASALQARLDEAYALIQPFVTGAMGEQVGSRFSTLDSAAQFDAAQASLAAVAAQRRARVPAMLP